MEGLRKVEEGREEEGGKGEKIVENEGKRKIMCRKDVKVEEGEKRS